MLWWVFWNWYGKYLLETLMTYWENDFSRGTGSSQGNGSSQRNGSWQGDLSLQVLGQCCQTSWSRVFSPF